ncbi:MAG: DUF411 domain-containing protein [Thiobacillaceae bacterium]
MYQSPTYGCCEKYVDYRRENSFWVKAIDESDMSVIKKRRGAARLASCHTALVDAYEVDGHVQIGAIRKMLEEKPAITGISAGQADEFARQGRDKEGHADELRRPRGWAGTESVLGRVWAADLLLIERN